MRVFFASWCVNSLCLYILARVSVIKIHNLVPPDGFITKHGLITILVGGLVIGLFNAVLKPVLSFLSLPLTCLTLGLFTFVVTGVVFYLTVVVTPGMEIINFWWAILGGVLFGIMNSLISGLLGIKKDEDKD